MADGCIKLRPPAQGFFTKDEFILTSILSFLRKNGWENNIMPFRRNILINDTKHFIISR
jgi:hypothetical protein